MKLSPVLVSRVSNLDESLQAMPVPRAAAESRKGVFSTNGATFENSRGVLWRTAQPNL